MNILQRAAAKILPESWFAPSKNDRVHATVIGHALTPREINARLNLARMGDTRLLSSFKSEMRSTDGDLESHVGKLEGMLTQAPLELMRWPPAPVVKASKPTADEVEANEVTAYCKEQLLDPDLDLGAVIRHALWGQMDGLAGFQMIVRPDGKRFKLVSLDPVPSERYHWPSVGLTLVVQPGGDGGELVPIEQLGIAAPVLVIEPHVTLRDRVGLLRRCMAPWYTKLNGFEGWARNVDLTGIPFRKIKYKGTLDETKLAKLEGQVRAMHGSGYGFFPDSIDMDWITQAAGNRSAHQDLVSYCNQEKAKVLLGSTQTSEIGKSEGSQSSAEVHERATEIKADGYGRQVCAFLRAQVLKPLVALSFGMDVAERSTPLPYLRVRSYADLLKLAQAVKTFGEGGVDSLPYSWFHSQSGVPIPADGERVIVFPRGTAPAPPTTPGAPPDGLPLGASRQRAAATAREVEALLPQLEREALEKVAGSGDSVIAPYVTLIEETRRDGGDLGHLLARVRLQAQMQGRDAQATRDILAAISAKALLTGFTAER